MTNVAKDLPGLSFHANYSIADSLQLRDAGTAIHHARYNLADQLAQRILEERKFFEIREQPGSTLIDVRADCYVLTAKELRDELCNHFRLGVDHAISAYRR